MLVDIEQEVISDPKKLVDNGRSVLRILSVMV